MNSPISSLAATLLALLALLLSNRSANAFSTTSSSSPSSCSHHVQQCASSVSSVIAIHRRRSSSHSATIQLQSTTNADNEASSSSSSSSTTIAEMTELEAAQTRETPKLTPDDKSLVRTLVAACAGNVEAMENAITANLDNMHPRLVVALQIAADKKEWKAQDDDNADDADDDEEFESQMVTLGTSLQNVLDVNLRSGREMLAELLNAGEIRKLDSLIGKSAKDGKLDMSFFTVLGMNMKDAAMMSSDNDNDEGSGESLSTSLTPTLATGEGQEQVDDDQGQPIGANRLQILQHIYTRCQEELEKNVPPGIGLLNKLLRTDISSIRTNQLSHYLGPQATTITSPDGKTIELKGSTAQPLVSHGEFIEALSNAVTQIRTLEAAGGTDRLSAMNLVESMRQVAIEAMGVLVSSFGEESDVVKEFQRDLQPVFRPGSE